MTDSEINEAVAKKLGWKQVNVSKLHEKEILIWNRADEYDLPDYCHSIQAAWEVVEKIHNQVLFTLWWHDGEWECDIETNERELAKVTKADTAPRAICLAFLKL